MYVFSALPDSIGQLSSLQKLDCSYCELTGTCIGLPVDLAQVHLHNFQPFQIPSGSSPPCITSIAAIVSSLVRVRVCRVVPSRTSTTFGLSAVSAFVFADTEKQRVRTALPNCADFQIHPQGGQV
jgi:hypothetical protein